MYNDIICDKTLFDYDETIENEIDIFSDIIIDKPKIINDINIILPYKNFTKNVYHHKIPKILQEYGYYLADCVYTLNTTEDDGRTASTLDEKVIIDLLLDKFGNKHIFKPKKRDWYDILVTDETGIYPVNIKITFLNQAINSCNYKACGWAFSNAEIDIYKKANSRYDSLKLFNYWKENFKNIDNIEIPRDYWMLVINKENTRDVIINSLRGIVHLTPNASNMPFQISFNNTKYKHNGVEYTNRDFCEKSVKDSYLHYLDVMRQNEEKDFRLEMYNNNRIITELIKTII